MVKKRAGDGHDHLLRKDIDDSSWLSAAQSHRRRRSRGALPWCKEEWQNASCREAKSRRRRIEETKFSFNAKPFAIRSLRGEEDQRDHDTMIKKKKKEVEFSIEERDKLNV